MSYYDDWVDPNATFLQRLPRLRPTRREARDKLRRKLAASFRRKASAWFGRLGKQG